MEVKSINYQSWLVIAAVIVVLAIFSLFSWRVFSFYRQIKNGTLDVSSLSFNSTKIDAKSLRALADKAPGSGALATDDDPSLGSRKAPVTIVEFADFGCTYSAEESFVVRALAEQYPDEIRIIFRDFPLVELHPGADLAAMGGACAEEQDKFWEYHDAIFAHPVEFTTESLIDYADEAGLNTKRFTDCLASNKYEEEVQTDLADGVAAGVTGTPTFFINGTKVAGNIPFSIFNELIHAFLEK